MKVVYLDQNKWIDLARAFYGKKDGEPFVGILEALTTKVDRGDIVLPLAINHYIETARTLNQDRKQRLADFMAKMSRGYSIRPYTQIRNAEIEHATKAFLSKESNKIMPRKLVVGDDFFTLMGSIGTSDVRVEPIPAASSFFITLPDIHTASYEWQKEDIASLDLQKIDRETYFKYGKTADERLRIKVYELLKGPLAEQLWQSLASQGATQVDLDRLFSDPMKFIFSIPSLDVFVNLQHQKNEDRSRPIDKNDTNDIAFLAAAIPYTDIVVGERYWIKKAESRGFDKKYGCTLATDFSWLGLSN